MLSLLTVPRVRRLSTAVAAGVLVSSLAACSDSGSGSDATTEVKLGYFPNLTHASAIVGIDKGLFDKALKSDSGAVKVFDFNSGSDVITQLQSAEWRVGRVLHRSEPGDHGLRLRPERLDHQRCHVRRCLAHGQGRRLQC